MYGKFTLILLLDIINITYAPEEDQGKHQSKCD